MACAELRIDHDVAECIVAGTVARWRTALSFADIEAVIRIVLPDTHFTRSLNAHPNSYSLGQPASLAQAQEAISAVVAQYGGHVEIHRYPVGASTLGGVNVETHGISATVFFFSEEVPPDA